MTAQLGLRWNGRSYHDAAWQDLRRLLREAVDFLGVKQVAYDLDVAPSALLHALDERERHHVRAEWIPYLIARAPNTAIVEFLAGLRGLEVQPARPVTPEEELVALKEALSESLGPELLAAITIKARKHRR